MERASKLEITQHREILPQHLESALNTEGTVKTFKLKGMGVGRQQSREGEICSSRKKILPSVY